MSQLAQTRRRNAIIIAVSVLVLAAVAAVGWWLIGGDDDKPSAATPVATTSTPGATPTNESTTSTPTPTATATAIASPSCEGPDTQFNVEGVEQDSLLPDCGVPVVTRQEQRKSGLGLGCGGTYPVILFKTTTTDAKTSICGRTSSGESFRLVTKPRGGEIVDTPGSYDPQRDAFVARKDGTTYVVQAYSGDLLITEDGRTTKQDSSDYISLDNESDYD